MSRGPCEPCRALRHSTFTRNDLMMLTSMTCAPAESDYQHSCQLRAILFFMRVSHIWSSSGDLAIQQGNSYHYLTTIAVFTIFMMYIFYYYYCFGMLKTSSSVGVKNRNSSQWFGGKLLGWGVDQACSLGFCGGVGDEKLKPILSRVVGGISSLSDSPPLPVQLTTSVRRFWAKSKSRLWECYSPGLFLAAGPLKFSEAQGLYKGIWRNSAYSNIT